MAHRACVVFAAPCLNTRTCLSPLAARAPERRYQTRLRTLGDELLTLPNSALATTQVVNLSRRKTKPILSTLRVRYADVPRVGDMVDELRTMALELPQVARLVKKGGQRPVIHLSDYGKTAVEIECKVFVGPYVDFRAVKQTFLLQCAEVMAKHGVQFAEPMPVAEAEA